ncbi:MAG: hypothetical protein US31_C0004G0002 [Berkelbacteria bacterium GW2011_GWA1_36_9]|uniref:Uncharacterized protein n=1 Tax=Berkelbacteria bacterium GW2011_GWA1_36_9 TaxID=1618331 RepID=A0A0G0FX89_9BACT|nr:MAG: hypothetical protein US31_C0004G0002 [Berkelbacteria bacterium GW2011_GWA1_36_9]
MKISDRLNILTQSINFALFLYLSITAIKKGLLNLTELMVLGHGSPSGLIISLIAEFER